MTDHGALRGLGDDDHPQYLLVDGSRALTGSLRAGGKKITGLAAGEVNGDAVRYEQAVKSGDAAAGDLAGNHPASTVAKLQNTTVSAAAPTSGQVLAFDGSVWKPTAASTGRSGISGWETVLSRRVVAAGLEGGLEAACPTGKKVVGGGFGSDDVNVHITSSGAGTDGTRGVVVQNNASMDVQVTVQAVCVNAAS